MPMYDLLDYSGNYSMISESLWNYYRDESNDKNENDNNGNKINNNETTTGESLTYKTKVIGVTPNNGSKLNAKLLVLLKYLRVF